MRQVQQGIHNKGHNGKMIDNDLYYEGPEHFGHVGFSLRDIDRIRELRVMSKATNQRLAEMEEDKDSEEKILRERTLLKAIQGDLSRLERKAIFNEMGFPRY
jgi:hypothetical protein